MRKLWISLCRWQWRHGGRVSIVRCRLVHLCLIHEGFTHLQRRSQLLTNISHLQKSPDDSRWMHVTGKNHKPTRTNRTEPEHRFFHEPNPNLNVKMCKNPNRTEPYPVKNWTEPEPKCHGSDSVLSLNETVGTFTHFTVNETFYST